MRISSRGEYGLRALIDLGEHFGEGPIPCTDIATRQHIPKDYLDQLMPILRDAGFVESLRGPGGGHQLARSPDEIQLSEALAALEGPLDLRDCVDEAVAENCALSGQCSLRAVWLDLRSAMDEVLGSRTLADLCRDPAGQVTVCSEGDGPSP